MNALFEQRPALVLIDVQQGFEDVLYWGGQRNNPGAEENINELLQLWRKLSLPVYHVKHCSVNPQSPLYPGKPGNDFMPFALPGSDEPVIAKNVNSAFIGTSLQHQLIDSGIKDLVLAGFTTDHCVSTTTRMAGNLGFNAFVVEDAAATFKKKGTHGEYFTAELIHRTALASLDTEFATVVNTAFIKEQLSMIR